MACAPPRVAATITCIGVSPALAIAASSRCSAGPCRLPMLPASLPAAMVTPAAASLRRLAKATSLSGGALPGLTHAGSLAAGTVAASAKLAIACASPRRRSMSLNSAAPLSTLW